MKKYKKLLKEKIFKIMKYIIVMFKKEVGFQLTLYGIFLAILLPLIIINNKFNLLGLEFFIPTLWLVLLFLMLLVPLFVFMGFQLYSNKENGENIEGKAYYKISKGMFHLFLISLYFIFTGIIFDLLFINLLKLSGVWLSLTISFIIIVSINTKISNFFKKFKINIYNPFMWLKTTHFN